MLNQRCNNHAQHRTDKPGLDLLERGEVDTHPCELWVEELVKNWNESTGITSLVLCHSPLRTSGWTHMMSVNGFRLCTTSFGIPFSSMVAAWDTKLVVIWTIALAVSTAYMHIMTYLSIWQPKDWQPKEYLTGFDSSSYFVNPSIVKGHPAGLNVEV